MIAVGLSCVSVSPYRRLSQTNCSLLWGARESSRIFPLQHLHAGLFIRADHQATCLVEAQGVDIKLPNVPRLGFKRGGVAIEPIHTAMRFEVRFLQNPPEARATHEPAPMVLTQDGQHVIEA